MKYMYCTYILYIYRIGSPKKWDRLLLAAVYGTHITLHTINVFHRKLHRAVRYSINKILGKKIFFLDHKYRKPVVDTITYT